jgi:hypothetical protein
VHKLVHLLFCQLLPLYDRGLALDGLPDGFAELLLHLFVILDGVIGLSRDVSTHDSIGIVALLLFFRELIINFEHIFLQIIDQHIALLHNLINLGHDLPDS